jgi:excisionase family DNA binding protein
MMKSSNHLSTAATVMTVEEAAEYLRFHPSTVYRLARSGQLPARKVGKQWRLHRESIDRWLRSEPVPASRPAAPSGEGR